MAVMIQLLSLCLLVLLVEGSTQTNTTTTPDTSTQITTTTTSEGSTQTNTTTTPDVSTHITTTTTSEGSTQTNTTTTPDVSTQITTTTTSEGTTQTTTTTAPGPCSSNPCPFDSNCQELLTNYTCVCRPGLFYDAKLRSCNLAKTFPSDIRFTKMDYNSNMADKNSEIFQQKANDILKEINTVLTNTDGYLGSVVKSLSKGSVIADVENFYSPLSKVDEVTVQTELRNLPETEVKMKDICSTGFCEETSTDCDSKTGLAECSCKNGYIKLTATQQACFPCPSGEKAVGSEKCEQCPFGYSGFNCKESYLLILVVVACVLGILLLGTLIGAIVLYLRSTKETKSPGKNSPNGNLEFNKPAGIPRIPRANPNGGWQPTNLEMADSGSRNALVTKDTDNTRMWDYAYIDDARSQKSQTSFRTGYGASGANNGPKANRNPYYDAYEDKMRRY